MRRLYCAKDGTKPGPHPPLALVFRQVYKKYASQLFPLATPLFKQMEPLTGAPLRWGGSAKYFDVVLS